MGWENVAQPKYMNCKTLIGAGGAGTNHCMRGTGRGEFALEAQQSNKTLYRTSGTQAT